MLGDDDAHPLLQAAIDGDFDKIKELHASGVNLNIRYIQGQTALHFAAEHGHQEIVDYLCGQGIDINAQDSSGRTALYMAAEGEHLGIISILHGYNAELEAGDSYNRTALHMAISGNKELSIKCLLELGAKPSAKDKSGETALHYAVNTEDLNLIEVIYNSDQTLLNIPDEYGTTPLHLAVEGDADEVIDFLCALGADMYTKNSNGDSPLHGAAGSGCYDAVCSLLANGFDVNYKNKDGQTALFFAAESAEYRIFQLLYRHKGVELDTRDKHENTVLHIVARRVHLSVIEEIARDCLDISKYDDETKLYAKIIKLLIKEKSGLKLDDEDSHGRTAYHLAGEYSREQQDLEKLESSIEKTEWRKLGSLILQCDNPALFLTWIKDGDFNREGLIEFLLRKIVANKQTIDAILHLSLAIAAWKKLSFDSLQASPELIQSLPDKFEFTELLREYLEYEIIIDEPDEKRQVIDKIIKELEEHISDWIQKKKKLLEVKFDKDHSKPQVVTDKEAELQAKQKLKAMSVFSSEVRYTQIAEEDCTLGIEEFNKLPSSGFINPYRLRTAQGGINKAFSDGTSLDTMRQSLIADPGYTKYVQPIEIGVYNGRVFSFDTRRLVVHQQAREKNADVMIKYKKIDGDYLEQRIKEIFSPRPWNGFVTAIRHGGKGSASVAYINPAVRMQLEQAVEKNFKPYPSTRLDLFDDPNGFPQEKLHAKRIYTALIKDRANGLKYAATILKDAKQELDKNGEYAFYQYLINRQRSIEDSTELTEASSIDVASVVNAEVDHFEFVHRRLVLTKYCSIRKEYKVFSGYEAEDLIIQGKRLDL